MEYLYEEFYSKSKGKTYRIMDIRAYVQTLPDNEKYEGHSDEIVCTCPYCSSESRKADPTYHYQKYLKKKLYITKDFKTGFCHRCRATYITDEFDIRYEIPDLSREIGITSVTELDFSITDPKMPNLLQLSAEINLSQEHKNLLYKRNPYIPSLQSDLKLNSFGKDKVILPFYYKGDLIYYQFWQPGQIPKYRFPRSKAKPLYICGELKKKAVIVEGVFDAIACRILYPDRTPIAILGCSMSIAQEIMLRSLMFYEIEIRLDESSLSWELYNRLAPRLDFTDFTVYESDGTDPEEYLQKLIRQKYAAKS